MSFNRKKYDESCYNNQVKRDDSIRNYVINTPENNCKDCYQTNPEIINQSGVKLGKVPIENDLFGIDRKDGCNEYNNCNDKTCKTQTFDQITEPKEECNINTVNSRFVSVKNLKESTINRWEWLRINPQNHAISELQSVSARDEIKKNYNPNYEIPNNQTNELEYNKNINVKTTTPVNINPL